MAKLIRRHHRYFLLSFIVLFFFGGRPAEFGQEISFFQGYLIPKPVIRVALGVNLEDIHIHASSGMKLYLANQNYKLLGSDIFEIRVRAYKEKLTEKFLVLAAQSRRREDAEKTAKDLRAKISFRVYVTEDKAEDLEGVFQVRVGDFLARSEALSFIKRLAQLGFPEGWIIREDVTEPASKPRWVMINDELLDLDQRTALYIIPANGQSYLAFGGHNYRGIFVLKGSRRGVLLINILNLEDYLKGVVPGELSPLYYGELEALKAQAVAARTYALKNLGQFEDLGFDLYDTPASQVYDGMSIEHPLSSRAVDETRGQVAVYGGKLINALYSSTCGGVTENAEAVFGGPPVPYLKSTECVWENEKAFSLKAGAAVPAVFESGKNISPELAELEALDVLDLAAEPASWYGAAAMPGEAAVWARKAAAAAGRIAGKVEPQPGALTPLALGRLLVRAFGWEERVGNLVGKSEAEHVTKNWKGLRPPDRPLAAFLLTSGILTPDPDPSADGPLTRARAALIIRRALVFSRDPYRSGNFESLAGGAIVVSEDGETKTLALRKPWYLFRRIDGETAPAASAELTGGEVLRWIGSGGVVRLLEVQAAPPTNILDRSSQYHSWQVRVSLEDLEVRLNQFYPIGKLIDLVPKKRGVSKRLLDLLIVGQEGQVRATGMKIRQVLNVRDTLFVIETERDAEGKISHFVFTGKGWGHGVGLCQVGAFRMAQKGATCDQILKKYYRGIKLKKEY